MPNAVVESKNWSFRAEGMHCIKCIRKIQSVEGKFEDIRDIKVDLGSKQITVNASADFDVEKFKSEVTNQGFHLKHIEKSELDSKINSSSHFLLQIGIAGFCAGNIMLFSAAEYVGANVESWSRIFPILSGILFLPVLFYSAQPFFLNSYFALRAKRVSIDSPIVLAIIGGSGLSYLNLVFGRAEVYFDSMAMFIFLLLSSRYLIFKIQNKYLSPIQVEDVYSENSVLTFKNNLKVLSPLSELTVGDLIFVEKNKYVPLDGELVSEEALIDDAFFSGEFLPKPKSKQDLIYAGSKVISKDIILKVKKKVKDTRLSEIVEKLNKSLNEKTEITTLADRGANYFTLGVIGLSILILSYFSFYDFQEGLNRVLALLVVACPCGLAIVVPLIQSLTLKKGLKKSLLIKKPSVLETVGDINSMYFDKTGTLTSGEIQVVDSLPRSPSLEEKEIIFNLEKLSEHPIAIAIIKWIGSQKNIEVIDYIEKIGVGVSGFLGNDYYELKSAKNDEKSAVQFLKNGHLLLNIFLEDTLSLGSKKLIQYLDSKGIKSYILSGDIKSHADKIASELNIPAENVYSSLSPEDKISLVKKINQPAIYIGDGVNDSMAMSQCHISISMESSANVAFKSSDVHILSGGLKGVTSFFELSENYLRTIKYTVFVSFMYNTIFAVFALLGLIGPLIAVFLMPLSSISVTFLAIYLLSENNRKKLNLSKGLVS